MKPSNGGKSLEMNSKADHKPQLLQKTCGLSACKSGFQRPPLPCLELSLVALLGRHCCCSFRFPLVQRFCDGKCSALLDWQEGTTPSLPPNHRN